jgi:hypothetical protein
MNSLETHFHSIDMSNEVGKGGAKEEDKGEKVYGNERGLEVRKYVIEEEKKLRPLVMLLRVDVHNCPVQTFPNCGARPPVGAVCSLGGGASYLCEGHIYFERNMGAR